MVAAGHEPRPHWGFSLLLLCQAGFNPPRSHPVESKHQTLSVVIKKEIFILSSALIKLASQTVDKERRPRFLNVLFTAFTALPLPRRPTVRLNNGVKACVKAIHDSFSSFLTRYLNYTIHFRVGTEFLFYCFVVSHAV